MLFPHTIARASSSMHPPALLLVFILAILGCNPDRLTLQHRSTTVGSCVGFTYSCPDSGNYECKSTYAYMQELGLQNRSHRVDGRRDVFGGYNMEVVGCSSSLVQSGCTCIKGAGQTTTASMAVMCVMNNAWEEYAPDGKTVRLIYAEVKRDDWSVYLTRNVQIDLWTKRISTNGVVSSTVDASWRVGSPPPKETTQRRQWLECGSGNVKTRGFVALLWNL
ncbi:hypothetical protein BC829DRAFT_466623 [Chytridium lagenaria]|nr:hypothetical protein BC829DRAFT_466623 [Chytridium lagenaria]